MCIQVRVQWRQHSGEGPGQGTTEVDDSSVSVKTCVHWHCYETTRMSVNIVVNSRFCNKDTTLKKCILVEGTLLGTVL